MNERIKELVEQARLWAEEAYKKQNDQFASHWDNPIGYTPTQFFEQKFAELIVRECAELIDNKEMITALQTYDEVFVAKYDTKEQCSKQILEHFGVA